MIVEFLRLEEVRIPGLQIAIVALQNTSNREQVASALGRSQTV